MELVDEETPLVKGKNPRIENDDDASNDSRDFEPLIDRVKDVIRVYWFLGLIAFGGPTAHVGIFQDHLVRVHQWLKEDLFLELFALAQGLPGPSSSQLIISTAATHGGVLGGSIAFLMWNLPGFVVLTAASLFLYDIIDPSPQLLPSFLRHFTALL